MKLKRLLIGMLFLTILLFIGKIAVYNYIYPYKYKETVNEYSKEYNLDPLLVLSVIKAESNFNPKAQSHKDAFGLMQITDTTAEWIVNKMDIKNYNKEMLKNPEFNIKLGCWYLNNLRTEFNDMDLVLAAYNGGRGHVNNWLKDYRYSKDGRQLHYIPFKETDKYIKKVKINYNIYKFLYDKNKK